MANKILTVLTVLAAAATATAHFPFLVPDGPDKGKAVFSDSLKPDSAGVPVDKIAGTKLAVIDNGKAAELSWTHDKTANCYTFAVPGTGSRIVIGTTDYGVLQRGDAKPFLLRYYSKAIFGEIPTEEKATARQIVPIELIPIVEGSKLRFKVVAGDKAMAKLEVTVLIPGEEKSKVVITDEAGLTSTFEKSGAYGAYAGLAETKSGEQGGKKYEEVRSYATLVVRLGK